MKSALVLLSFCWPILPLLPKSTFYLPKYTIVYLSSASLPPFSIFVFLFSLLYFNYLHVVTTLYIDIIWHLKCLYSFGTYVSVMFTVNFCLLSTSLVLAMSTYANKALKLKIEIEREKELERKKEEERNGLCAYCVYVCLSVCVFVMVQVNICVCLTMNILFWWGILASSSSFRMTSITNRHITSVLLSGTAKTCSLFSFGGFEVLLWGRVFTPLRWFCFLPAEPLMMYYAFLSPLELRPPS